MCQFRTHAPQQIASLFDNFVSASEQRRRHLQLELLSSLLIHDQLKLGWSLHGHFGRIGASQNSINVRCRAHVHFLYIRTIRDETASHAEEPERIDRRKTALRHEPNEPFSLNTRD